LPRKTAEIFQTLEKLSDVFPRIGKIVQNSSGKPPLPFLSILIGRRDFKIASTRRNLLSNSKIEQLALNMDKTTLALPVGDMISRQGFVEKVPESSTFYPEEKRNGEVTK
jgi:hypothetical protein